mgnify:CR=1 FL=1
MVRSAKQTDVNLGPKHVISTGSKNAAMFPNTKSSIGQNKKSLASNKQEISRNEQNKNYFNTKSNSIKQPHAQSEIVTSALEPK